MAEKKTSKRSKELNPFTLIFSAVLALYLLSFVIPSGTYNRVEGAIDPQSFHLIPKQYLSPWGLLRQIGAASSEQFGLLWVNIFATGGVVALLTETGTLNRAINRLILSMRDRVLILVPTFCIFMFFAGSVGAFVNTALALIPVGLVIARTLRVDGVFAVGIVMFSAWAGLWFSGVEPVGLGLAQNIAALRPFSGIGHRLIFGLIAITLISAFMTIHAFRVRKNPSRFAIGTLEVDNEHNMNEHDRFQPLDLALILIFMGSVAFFGVGAALWGYGTSEFTGIMLANSIIIIVGRRLSIAQGMQFFASGAGGMIVPVLILIFSQAISIILSETKVTDTIIHYLSMPLIPLGGAFAALGMFGINALINTVIYAYVPQISITMPIMAPLADAIEIPRQTAVLSVQYGAGVTDFLTPFNGVLLAALGFAKVNFRDWLRFIWPLVVAITAIMVISITIAALTNYS